MRIKETRKLLKQGHAAASFFLSMRTMWQVLWQNGRKTKNYLKIDRENIIEKSGTSTSSKEIKAGDIITFGSLNSDNITTHRVKEVINEEGKIKYITQGDANNVQDPSPVPEEVLIGKVVKWIPKLGSIMSWMKSNLMIILGAIFAITALLVIGNVLIDRLKAIDEEEKEKVDANS